MRIHNLYITQLECKTLSNLDITHVYHASKRPTTHIGTRPVAHWHLRWRNHLKNTVLFAGLNLSIDSFHRQHHRRVPRVQSTTSLLYLGSASWHISSIWNVLSHWSISQLTRLTANSPVHMPDHQTSIQLAGPHASSPDQQPAHRSTCQFPLVSTLTVNSRTAQRLSSTTHSSTSQLISSRLHVPAHQLTAQRLSSTTHSSTSQLISSRLHRQMGVRTSDGIISTQPISREVSIDQIPPCQMHERSSVDN